MKTHGQEATSKTLIYFTIIFHPNQIQAENNLEFTDKNNSKEMSLVIHGEVAIAIKQV